jgi:Zn-dependent metalloprotease
VCSIIPPHMLREISRRGNPEERARAFEALLLTERFRGRRDAVGGFAVAVPAGKKRRTIYDAKNSTNLPGVLVRGEGDPVSKDPAVNEAYNGSGATYDFYLKTFNRNSIDNLGMRLDSTVHYGTQYDNAFWNGSQMVYGDGDGQLFNRFTKALDVIGHELTHGVTEHEAKLNYQNEPGALNESMSDVFGILVKQFKLKQKADKADWIIGAGLFTSSVNGVGIRSMKAPGTAYDDPVLGKDPQPDNVKNMYRGMDDNGGVHINSGIPNLAFCTAANAIGGFAWLTVGKIWYVALTERMKPDTDFKQAAGITIAVAAGLFGPGSKEQNAVTAGWKRVGVVT